MSDAPTMAVLKGRARAARMEVVRAGLARAAVALPYEDHRGDPYGGADLEYADDRLDAAVEEYAKARGQVAKREAEERNQAARAAGGRPMHPTALVNGIMPSAAALLEAHSLTHVSVVGKVHGQPVLVTVATGHHAVPLARAVFSAVDGLEHARLPSVALEVE